MVVTALFVGDGNMLADVGMDDDHCICVWDWRKQEKIASTRFVFCIVVLSK